MRRLIFSIGVGLLIWTSCQSNSVNFELFPEIQVHQYTQVVSLPGDIPPGPWKGLIVMKFDSECHLCHDKMKAMAQDARLLSDFYIVLLSSEGLGSIEAFSNTYQLYDKVNCAVGQLSEAEFYDSFNAAGAPYTLVYNKRGEEVYRFEGNPSLKPILQAFFDVSP